MKCPCPFYFQAPKGFLPQDIWRECVEEKCAWWDSYGRACAILSIYQELRLLVGAAGMFVDKLLPTKE